MIAYFEMIIAGYLNLSAGSPSELDVNVRRL